MSPASQHPVAILYALEAEGAELEAAIQEPRERMEGGKRFLLGTVSGTPVALGRMGIGKVAASLTTAMAIERLCVRAAVVIGTAGALHRSIRVGDVVIARQTIQHDLGVREGRRMETDPSLSQALSEVAGQAVPASRVHHGTILTGDRACFTWRRRLRLRWAFRHEKPLVVEMEGAAAGYVAASLGVPFAAVRVASDHAGPLALVEFRRHLALVAPLPGRVVLRWLAMGGNLFPSAGEAARRP
ncbi:MAG: 5'-methylthioadenosine/S-adenosylhomocysteine nucleosidase [Planctomycetes bacterium]|nr:5'-methylthioadenosine/S-adenosylhomocysteine nucleosidase [Planctomycetota bacterium]